MNRSAQCQGLIFIFLYLWPWIAKGPWIGGSVSSVKVKYFTVPGADLKIRLLDVRIHFEYDTSGIFVPNVGCRMKNLAMSGVVIPLSWAPLTVKMHFQSILLLKSI